MISDAGMATIAYFALLVLLSRQMAHTRSPASISRVSRWSFLTSAIVDSISFAGHITFAIIAQGRPSLALIAPAFLACLLFIYEAVRSHTTMRTTALIVDELFFYYSNTHFSYIKSNCRRMCLHASLPKLLLLILLLPMRAKVNLALLHRQCKQ